LFAGAIERVRETAKWIIAGFGAIGLAIAGESVLSNVGEASGVRLAIAIIAAATGLGAVALAIWKTADVLLPSQVSVQDITKYPKLRAALDADPILFRGIASGSSEFVEVYRSRSDQFVQASQAHRQAPSDETKLALAEARRQVIELTPVIDGLTDITLYEKVRTSFDIARRWIFTGAVGAGVALVVFAAAANPPEDSAGDNSTSGSATAAATEAPTPVQVSLTDEGVRLLKQDLGCDNRALEAIAVAGEPTSLDVVTAEAGCRIIRFTLTPELGTAMPSQPVRVR